MRNGTLLLTLCLALAGAVMVASRTHAAAAQASTLRFVERGGGISFVDNAPKAKSRYDFSPGDIVIVTRVLDRPAGGRAGVLRLACIANTPAHQHCTGSADVPGGTLEFSGESGPMPVSTVAVIGGTGAYAGARGTSTSADRHGGGDVADEVIHLEG